MAIAIASTKSGKSSSGSYMSPRSNTPPQIGLTVQALQRSSGQCVDIYTRAATRQTFERLLACARTVLAAEYPVIVDATFLGEEERRKFRALADELDVPFAILDCRAAEATLRQRVQARSALAQDASEADLAVLERQLASRKPLNQDELALALVVNTDAGVDMQDLRARWWSVPRMNTGAPDRYARGIA